MFNKSIFRLPILFMVTLLFFTACTDDNSVTVLEEEEKEIKTEYNMRVNRVAQSVNTVYAAYCENDTTEFTMIANKRANLQLPFSTENWEEGDFAFMTSTKDGETKWSYGGQALGSDVTGQPFLLISFSDAKIQITDRDDSRVVGSSEGSLFNIPSNPNELPESYPYQMDFVAEIVEVSNYCN